MIERRPYSKLGGDDLDWLKTRHHFSFADYYDERRMGWGALRVWNDDEIQPRTGFPSHSHASMEIITYVREGAITHKDSLGNEGRTVAGDVQVMSAGTGIRHSEYNLESVTTKIFQIWIIPTQAGGPPAWGAKPFPKSERAGQLVTLAGGEPSTGGLPIRADARVLGASLKSHQSIQQVLEPGRLAYLVPASGVVEINGLRIEARDGAAISGVSRLEIAAAEDSEIVLVEVAA
jgi:quercetin 2,3-dioxygenase